MSDIEEKVEGVHKHYKRILHELITHQLQFRSDHKAFARTFDNAFEREWDKRLEQLLLKRNAIQLDTGIHTELLNIKQHLTDASPMATKKGAKDDYMAILRIVNKWARAFGGLIAVVNVLTIFPNKKTNPDLDISAHHETIKEICWLIEDARLGAHTLRDMVVKDMHHFTKTHEDKKVAKEFLEYFNQTLIESIFKKHKNVA